MSTYPNAKRFPELPADRLGWKTFGVWDRPVFPALLGLELEEVREGYARMRMPHRPELEQPLGVMHGGAIAGLIDTVVVPAIASAYESTPGLLTLDMQVQYLSAIIGEDVIGEGWVEKRGRSICFCRAEVRTASGELAATGTLTYKVRAPAE